MLDVFRSSLKHTKWILLLIVMSFVTCYGVTWWQPGQKGRSDNGGPSWPARVDGQEVPFTLWVEHARRLDEQYRRMFGGQYSQIRENLNLGRQAVDQLIVRTLVLSDCRRLGLTVSDDELGSYITSLPMFQRNGAFIGAREYEQVVNRGMIPGYGSVEQLEAAFREDLLVDKWHSLIGAAVTVPPQDVEKEFVRRHERVSFEYVALPLGEALKTVTEPSAAELENYYNAHRADYTQGEGRRALYVLVEDKTVENQVSVTDQEIEKYYQEHTDLFAKPEERHLRHILVKVNSGADEATVSAMRTKAEQIVARIRAGEDFGKLAVEFSEDPGSKSNGGDLGMVGKGRMVPEFDQVAFTQAVGVVSDPVRTSFGFHIIRVEGISQPRVQILAEVKDQIKSQIRYPKLREAARKMAQDFKDKVGKGGDFRGVANEMKLTVADSGLVSSSGNISGLGPVPEMIQALFSLEKGGVSDVIPLPKGEAVLTLQEIVPNFTPPLESIRARVIDEFKQSRARDKALADFRAALGGGTDLASAAQKLKLEVKKTEQPVMRGQAIPGIGQDPALEKAVFNGHPGEFIPPMGGTNSVVAFRLLTREQPDRSKFAEEETQLRETLKNSRIQRLVQQRQEELRQKAKVEYNEELLRRAG